MPAVLLIVATGVQVFLVASDPNPARLAFLTITALCTVFVISLKVRRG